MWRVTNGHDKCRVYRMITCFHHLRIHVTEVVGDKRKEPWMGQNVSFSFCLFCCRLELRQSLLKIMKRKGANVLEPDRYLSTKNAEFSATPLFNNPTLLYTNHMQISRLPIIYSYSSQENRSLLGRLFCPNLTYNWVRVASFSIKINKFLLEGF